MTARRRLKGRRASPFLVLSVLGHAAFFVLVATTSLGRGCASPHFATGGMGVRNNEPIDITMIEPTVLNPYARRPTPAEEQAAVEAKLEEARKPEEDRTIDGQVVDVAKPDVEIRPDDARFLSEFDNKVEKETKGKPGRDQAGAREKKVASVTRPQPPTPATPPKPAVEPIAPQTPKKGEQGDAKKGALAMRSSTKPAEGERGKEDGLVPEEGGDVARKGEGAEASERGGAPGEARPGVDGRQGQEASEGSPEMPRVSDLRPSDELVSQAVGVGSSDYLKDIDDGADTLLNTKRWKYASFFTRVKRGVAQSWRPDAAYRLRDPTGQIYGHKNRFTVLKVSLRPDGTLRDVMVEKPCGVDFLDDEAVTAFREAQPFPNPPPGLVDPSSNLITFRFGFYFEITGAPTFKIFRN
jgi:TonB family protein